MGGSASLEGDLRETIEHIRAGLAQIIAAAPAEVRRPTDLMRTMEIDKTLAWKVMRCLEADDAVDAAPLMPGPAGFDIFLRAAGRKGIDRSLIDYTTKHIEAYQGLIHRHAGDRRTFQRIIDGLSPRSRPEAEAAHRKSAFEANSFIWGVKVRTLLVVHIVCPNGDGETVDIAAISSFIDLVRIKPDTPWVISRTAYASEEGKIQPVIRRQPIERPDADPAALAHQTPLMTEFCSDPLPHITRRPVPGNFLETTLLPGPIGETAATTITTGEIYHQVAPRFREQSDDDAMFYVRLRTPAEHFVNVMLVQRGEFAPTPPRYGIYSELDSILHHPVDLDAHRPLTMDASLQHLGPADGPIVWAREAPMLGNIVRRACERLDWSLSAFDIYQARQSFPILRSVAIAAFALRKSHD